MPHLKIEHVLGTFKPNVCFIMAFETHFHIGRGILGWHKENISQQTIAFAVTLRSLCRNVSGNKLHRGPQKVWQCILDAYLSHTS